MADSATSSGVAAEVESLRAQIANLEATLKSKEKELATVYPYSRSFGKTSVNTILGAEDGGRKLVGQTLRVGGWVKTGRDAGAGAFCFLEVNDGSMFDSLQREDRLDVLERRLGEAGMDPVAYEGYMDLRRYGTVPHAGFGLGFERLILFATGLDNIREVIPFPRWPGNAAF
ncbi:Asparagine--tRNA ligase [Tetrabaena socialis]|uniref:Asparagine--tRNA ligase n=1 Tax=Tetrabaena socialis TaxID=47790 RepID=A0A2J7ZT93_9CHLO|nr:Asparagine--tRNA ligase [Tetrabaena socialis]|eukprot:PNH03491.1 Asparagine--tRNA ligase [Tetrabaena socialis]